MLHTGIYKSTTTIPTDELQSQQGYFSSMQYIIAPDLAITPGAGTDPTQGNAVQEQARLPRIAIFRQCATLKHWE